MTISKRNAFLSWEEIQTICFIYIYIYMTFSHSFSSFCVFWERRASDALKLITPFDNFCKFYATFRYMLLTNNPMGSIYYNIIKMRITSCTFSQFTHLLLKLHGIKIQSENHKRAWIFYESYYTLVTISIYK